MDPGALVSTNKQFPVELHPSAAQNVFGGVKEQLNAHLRRYVDEFDGVMLSYSNIKILTDKAPIHPYFPYFHLDVKADVLVFKPKAGMRLVGRVNQLGQDYIGALVLGTFNATIPARKVHTDLHFRPEEEMWVHVKSKKHKVKLLSYIVFTVDEVKDNSGYFQIQGSMLDKGTGPLSLLYPGAHLPDDDEDLLLPGAALKLTADALSQGAAGRVGTTTTGGAAAGPSSAAAANGDAGHSQQKKKDKKRNKGDELPAEQPHEQAAAQRGGGSALPAHVDAPRGEKRHRDGQEADAGQPAKKSRDKGDKPKQKDKKKDNTDKEKNKKDKKKDKKQSKERDS